MGEISHTSRLGVYKAVLNLTFWQMCKVVKIDTSWLVCPDGFPWQRKVIRVEGIQCTHGACSCKALPIAHKGVDPDPDVEMITNLLVNKLWMNLKSKPYQKKLNTNQHRLFKYKLIFLNINITNMFQRIKQVATNVVL